MNKLRWSKFFWSDWADDPALALCSHSAQSVWMRLLCIAAQGTPYGHITVNGKPPSIEDLAKLVRPSVRPARMARIVAELERRGVVKRTSNGCLFSARLTSDWHLMHARSDAAKSRWNKETDRRLHMQNHPTGEYFAYAESEAEADEGGTPPSTPYQESPLNPPPLRAGGLPLDSQSEKKMNGGAHEAGRVHAAVGGSDATTIRASRGNGADQDAAVPERPRRRPVH